MDITREISLVGGPGLTSPRDAAVYLVNFEGHAALVDAGCGETPDLLLQNIMQAGVLPEQVEYLLLTHCHFDHTGGVRSLLDRISCKVVAHSLDAAYLELGNDVVTAAAWYGCSLDPFPVDVKLSRPWETLTLGPGRITAVHVPGHSPGSVVYLTESEGLRVLFAQDVHGPLDPSLLSDRTAYLRSLKRIIALDADILCEGHFGIIRGKGPVRDFVSSFLDPA